MWIAHDSARPLRVPRPKPTRVHPSPPLVHRREPFASPSPRTVDRHVASITCTSQAKSNIIRNCVVNHSSHKGSEPPLVSHIQICRISRNLVERNILRENRQTKWHHSKGPN